MHVLHICNDFFSSKVHANLYRELDNLGVEQTVYATCTIAELFGNNEYKSKNTSFVHGLLLKKRHKYFYHYKVLAVFLDLCCKVKLKKIDIIYATTLFSDGAVAHLVHWIYRKPYIVAVRGTDVNTYLAKLKHTWLVGRRVLLGAEQIVFITPSMLQNFVSHPFIKRILPKIEHKFVIQPNGIDNYWIDNVKR